MRGAYVQLGQPIDTDATDEIDQICGGRDIDPRRAKPRGKTGKRQGGDVRRRLASDARTNGRGIVRRSEQVWPLNLPLRFG
jgi:hypothetical protein